MPKKLQTENGPPDELVPLQLYLPRWMKNRCIEEALARGKSLSDWARDRLTEDLGERDDRPKKRR
jgi:hypothetical protein